MEAFSSLDRFLLFATVGGMFAALAFYAAERTKRLWKKPFARFARASRPAQALVLAFLVAATAIGGGKTNAPPMRAGGGLVRTIPAEDLPAWFVALGHPAADADASGIPDCWEKWTHTRGFASDADPDGDGLTNLEEFEAQTDPIRADTDGDGIDDATELAGLAAGVADLDPAAPATFVANEPDADADGIPDIWKDSGVPLFGDVDSDGFPWYIDVPEPAPDNYDVRLSVTSSRHAALSWGANWGESLLLPPCTNLALRLRLSADEVQTVSLHPSPNASTNPVGTWRAALVADWDERRGLPTEDDRVAVPNGTMVDRSERASVSIEAWMPQTALRSGGMRRANRGRGRGEPEITFTPREIKLVLLEGSCRIHGPDPLIQVVATNAAPPYVWTDGGVETVTEQDTYRAHYALSDGHFDVSCRWRDSHSSLLVSDAIRCDPISCRPGQTNFVGAGWTSTHNPTNAADHAPGIVEVDRYFGPLCPVAHDVDVKLGWTHNTAILWIRNLVRIVTGDPMDDETDHCIARDWKENDIIDLWKFVDVTTLPHTNLLEIVIDGRVGHGDLRLGKEPKLFHPDVHHVELRMKDSNVSLDRMWIVINGTQTKKEFNRWFNSNATNMSWVATLPKPYAQLDIATNFWGNEYAVDPEPGAPNLWNKPKNVGGNLLHHDAVYTMRAPANSAGHGNQACYRADGSLIRSGMSGGTADFAAGEATSVFAHVEQDVDPFLHALHLDGNPCGITTFNNITRPCLRQGDYIDRYIQCRPVVQP